MNYDQSIMPSRCGYVPLTWAPVDSLLTTSDRNSAQRLRQDHAIMHSPRSIFAHYLRSRFVKNNYLPGITVIYGHQFSIFSCVPRIYTSSKSCFVVMMFYCHNAYLSFATDPIVPPTSHECLHTVVENKTRSHFEWNQKTHKTTKCRRFEYVKHDAVDGMSNLILLLSPRIVL